MPGIVRDLPEGLARHDDRTHRRRGDDGRAAWQLAHHRQLPEEVSGAQVGQAASIMGDLHPTFLDGEQLVAQLALPYEVLA